MRATFVKTLAEIASKDERVILLTADLGYTVLEEFADRNPKQFFNVGVAEQNMLGVATGLAEAGFIPLCIQSRHLRRCGPTNSSGTVPCCTTCACAS
jgi:transketolase